MQISLKSEREDFLKLKSEWDGLLQESTANCLFLTWDWLNTWLNCQDKNIKLCIITARNENNKLIGLAPLYHSQLLLLNTLKYKTLRVMADTATAAEYPDLITLQTNELAIKQQLLDYISQLPNWDIFWMPNHKGWTKSSRETKNLISNCSRIAHYSRAVTFSAFELPSTYESYLQRLSKKKRTDLRQVHRRIAQLGTIEIEQCNKAEQIDNFLNTLLELHALRWKKKRQLGSFIRNPKLLNFYREILPAAYNKGWLQFYLLKSNNKPVAIQIGYIYNNIFHAIQEGFDPNFHPGAGNLLRANIIKLCIESGWSEYDFLGGGGDHKRRWGSQERIGLDFFIYKKRFKNLPFYLKNIWPTGRWLTPK